MTELLFFSLVALSLGSLLSLPLISVREIGRGFFSLWTVTIAVLGAIALGLQTAGLAGAAGGAPGGRIALLLALALALLVPFWAALRWGAHGTATVLLLASALCGGLVLRELATASGAPPPWVLLRVASLLFSALAVGTVTVSMVLGHWYLVQPKLPLTPLRRLCDILLGVLLVRLAVSAWGFAASLHGGHRLLGGPDPIPWELLILSQRLLFGYVGSLILAVMIRKTVMLRSTMSATGLLYIAILFVWVGEFLSIYLGRISGGLLVV